MKETFYFSHDYNARNDDKILEIRDKYKNEGYAVFFYCLETMAERGDGYIIPTLIGGLSLGYGVSKEWLLEFLEFCIKIGIFKKDDVGYFSSRMISHIKFRAKLSKAGSDGAVKRWRGYSSPNSPPNAKERKGKERKVNINTLQATPADNINPLIKEFEELNPTINYGNKTQRKACEDLIAKFGYKKVIATLNYYKSIKNEKFSPVITTPYILQQKMGELLTFYNKSLNKPKIINLDNIK